MGAKAVPTETNAWTGPARVEEELEPIVVTFTRIAQKYPDKLLAVGPDRQISYGEVNATANRLAHKIIALRGRSQEPVAFLLGLEIDGIAAILGISKAAKIYAGLDPANPPEHLRSILEDLETNLLVTNQRNLALAQKICEDRVQIINLDALEPELSAESPDIIIDLDKFAAIYYTSGSTGKPKGIIQDHRALAFYRSGVIKFHNYTAEDRILVSSSLAFAWGVSRIYMAFGSDSTLYLRDYSSMSLPELTEWLMEERITAISMTASFFTQFLAGLPENSEHKFPHLRVINIAGEAFNLKDLEIWKKHFSSHCEICSSYASTEAGMVARIVLTTQTSLANGRPPFDKIQDGVKVFILDDANRPLPNGGVGRIAVESPNVARGYWRRPDLNKDLFLPDGQSISRKRTIITSDLGRIHTDGQLEFLGRGDAMLKVRGFRVEPGEIENALRAHPAIENAAIAGRRSSPEQSIDLIAYVIAKPGQTIAAKDLRDFLSAQVPHYMVPAYYIFLKEFPRTLSGKIDRQSLPDPDWTNSAADDIQAPQNDLEKYLVQLWQKTLGKERISVTDDFFALGGHSLAAFAMMTDIQSKVGRKVPMNTLIKHPTVQSLANAIETMKTPTVPDLVTAIRQTQGGPSFFIVPAAARTSLATVKFFGDNEGTFGLYGLEYPGMDGHLAPLDTVEGLAAFFIKQIQSVQPEGPYWLAGQCFGGIVAFEIAHQLLEKGQQISLVVLLDSTPVKMKDTEFIRDNVYYYGRLKKFLNPQNWGALLPYFVRRNRRNAVSEGQNEDDPYLAYRKRKSSEVDTSLDQSSQFVFNASSRARNKYEPHKLNAPGLALLNSASRVSERETVWRKLFAGFESHYIPNTTHSSLFSEPHSLQKIHKLITDTAQRILGNTA